MVASPQMVEPVEARKRESAPAQASVRLTEFSLTLGSPLKQVEVQYENPICRLAGRTAAGARACERGCGLGGGSLPQSHVCPFGMLICRTESPAGVPISRWVGRRFPSVRAMHQALDRLVAEGFDEDTILAHLPPNPIVTDEEMEQALERDEAPAAEPVPVAAPAAHADPAPPSTEPRFPVGNILEYLEQVHSLVATATRPDAAAERFLRAVTAAVPFDEMAIYLRERKDADLVIIASVEREKAGAASPRPQYCRLEPFGLGASSIAQRRILVQRQGKIEPFAGALEEACTLAVPFPLAAGEAFGVWLAHLSDPAPAAALGIDLVRFMRLLAEFLGSRLDQMVGRAEEKTEPAESRPAGAKAKANGAQARAEAGTWGPEELLAELKPEIARAARREESAALLRLEVVRSRRSGKLPVAELTDALRMAVRPYDQLARAAESGDVWYAILSSAREDVTRTVAARLMTVFEDVMDAHGGMEEKGLRLRVDASIWGGDAASAEEMLQHVTAARATGFAQDDATIQIYSARQDVVGL